jgi:integrase
MARQGKRPGAAAPKQPAGRQGPRREKGSGGLNLVRPGVWRVDIEYARDPVTGRRRRVSRTVQGTRRDAEAALARLRVADVEKRLPRGGTSAKSVRAAFDLYLEAAAAGTIVLAPRTLVTSRSAANTMCRMLLPGGRPFGTIALSRLTWQEIEQMYTAMRAEELGVDWVRRCATVLTRSLDFARKRGLIDSNPSKDATRPRGGRSKPVSPALAEVRALLDRARAADPELADAVTVLASTGMRKAELLGLQWWAVDLERREVHLAFAISDGGPGVKVVRKETKRSDWRDVPLTAQAVDALRRQHARAEERGEVGPSDYVFPGSPDPSVPIRPDTFADRWLAARGDSAVTLLQLRHFVATTMLDAGESYRTVADILGNSENTLRLHYDGRTDVGKRRAIEALAF